MSGVLQAPVTIAIRQPAADDQAFIASTFWRSVLGNNRAPNRRRRINEQIDRILDDSSTRCLVACSQTDAHRIIGWLLYAAMPAARAVHYAYVRDEERSKGVCRSLVAQAWPGSDARFVLTVRGPHTHRFLERVRGSVFVPLDEFWK